MKVIGGLMGEGTQAELFLKDKYGTWKCPKCRSVGTIVQMGACCRIQMMKGEVMNEQSAYETWRRKAVLKGWHLPRHEPGDESWMLAWARYWEQMEKYEALINAGHPDPGRPVIPHRSG